MTTQIFNRQELKKRPVTSTTRRSSVSVLHVLDSSGDTPIEWDREGVATSDPEALAALEEARQIFARARAQGATAFLVSPGAPARRLEHFDPDAEEIVVIPQMAGG